MVLTRQVGDCRLAHRGRVDDHNTFRTKRDLGRGRAKVVE